jgi:uncharacterized protein YbjT (DUF2867 family)
MNAGKAPILVVGATGRHGGTGAFVARRLIELGHSVRAMTRQQDATLTQQFPEIEIVIADLRDRRSLISACDGVEVAYFTYPIAGGVVEASANFASAARVGGVKRVVVMSMGPAHPESASHLGRAQWLAEEVLESSGVRCTFLRVAALFFENLGMLHREDVSGDGVMRNSFPNLAVNTIAGSDAGKLAVSALLHPERLDGKSTVYPSGGDNYTHAEVAQIIGNHIGRVLKHETITAEAWQERLIKLSQYDDRINGDMARHISALGASMQRPLPLNDLFKTMTGERPMSLNEALRSRYLAFERTRPIVRPEKPHD